MQDMASIRTFQKFLPWTAITYDEGVAKYTGILFDFLQFASRSFSFSYSYQDIGLISGNSSSSAETFQIWYDMAVKKECDILFAPFGASYKLLNILDLSAEFFLSRILIVSGSPERSSQKEQFNVLSLNREVASAVITFLFIFAFLSYLSERLHRATSEKKNSPNSPNRTLGRFLWMYFATIFQEPFSTKLKSPVSNMLCIMWWISLLFTMSAFGGNIKANLATAKHDTIENLEDIIRKPNLQPLIVKSSAYESIFKNARGNAAARVFEQSKRTNGRIDYFGSDIYAEDIITGKSVYLLPETVITAYLPYICRKDRERTIYIGEKEVGWQPTVIIFRKGLPMEFLENMNRRLRYFATTQQYTWSIRKNQYEISKCLWSPGRFNSVRANVLYVLYIWLSGMAISIVILLLEIATHMSNTAWKTRNKTRVANRKWSNLRHANVN